MKPHIVIIGGGFGGIAAARRLRHAPVDITLVDRQNHHLFQPLLYQVATGELSPADIATPLRRLFKRQPNIRIVLGEVTGFDVAARRVLLADGSTLTYDTLIVAAGAGTHYFGNDDWRRAAPGLKSIEDATEIRRRIVTAFEMAERQTDPDAARTWLTFAVVGGGPTGIELAGALAEIARMTFRRGFHNIQPSDARILLIHSRDHLLPGYHQTLSASAQAALEQRGIEVVTCARLTGVDAHGVTVSYGDRSDVIAAGTVLWAAGVKASPLGQALASATGAPLDRGGRVVVTPELSLPGHPDIFVIGDLAHVEDSSGVPLPGVVQVAQQQGDNVARRIHARLDGRTLPPFRYRSRGSMATIGRGAAVAEIGPLRLSGWLAWHLWLFIHLVYQRDSENRLLVLVQWLWNFATGDRSALLITNPPRRVTAALARLATATGDWQRVG